LAKRTPSPCMRICRFLSADNQVRIGLAKGGDALLDLKEAKPLPASD